MIAHAAISLARDVSDCLPQDAECIADEVAGGMPGPQGPVDATSDWVSGQASGMFDGMLDKLGKEFADAASQGLRWLWSEIDAATSIDLNDPVIRQPLAYSVGVALVMVVGLLVVQVALSALRRDPGGLARALKGAMIATIGAPFAIAVTQTLITATDSLCNGLVKATTGQANTAELGERLVSSTALAALSPVLAILVAVIVLFSTVMVWAALMLRKVLILIAAVFASIAFAGAASDFTTKWVRQVCEVMVALVISKFVIVMLFSIGYNMLVQPASGTTTAQAGTFGVGVLILFVAGFAPIGALKLVSFAGGQLDHLRAGSSVMAGPARAAASAPVKVAKAGAVAALGAATGGAGAAAAAGGVGRAGAAGAAGAAAKSPSPAMAGAGAPAGAAGAAAGARHSGPAAASSGTAQTTSPATSPATSSGGASGGAVTGSRTAGGSPSVGAASAPAPASTAAPAPTPGGVVAARPAAGAPEGPVAAPVGSPVSRGQADGGGGAPASSAAGAPTTAPARKTAGAELPPTHTPMRR